LQHKAQAGIEKVSGRDTVMMERATEFRVVVEGNKSDLQQVISKI
jgi:hypothetical protein